MFQPAVNMGIVYYKIAEIDCEEGAVDVSHNFFS